LGTKQKKRGKRQAAVSEALKGEGREERSDESRPEDPKIIYGKKGQKEKQGGSWVRQKKSGREKRGGELKRR